MTEKSSEKKSAPCLSILGTGSDVGKSIVVTALCRLFSDQGIRVAPFKAQNMSNNSFVTPEGGEMGRAQVVQAEAARVPLHVDMNPVLLKPSTDTGSQVVLNGKVVGTVEAHRYFADTNPLFEEAKKSLTRLRHQYELVVMEGAGSCAEVNLRDRDFVNFRMAHFADANVILVADIDRGGVFAQIIGTLAILPPEDRERIKGIIINRFRGDATLFKDGIKYIEEKTGLPVLGLIPTFRHIEIDSEDGMPLEIQVDPPTKPETNKINIAVIRFPHISNFTDFSPLQRDPSVQLHFLAKPRELKGYDILLLPGSKNVRFDREWLIKTGWDEQIHTYAHEGGRVGGICGGFQILGKVIHDPYGVEGTSGETPGLGLLNIKTTLNREKVLTRTTGYWIQNKSAIEGYEIHMGETDIGDNLAPMIHISSRNGSPIKTTDGARNSSGKIWGTYLHGLFDSPLFRHDFLKSTSGSYSPNDDEFLNEFKNNQYNYLAQHFKSHLRMNKFLKISGVDRHTEISR